jgi:quinol monooxygenase YgiN
MAGHMTVAKMTVQPGKYDELMVLMAEDEAENRRMSSVGWQGNILGRSKNDPNILWVAVFWDTSERYYKNAESPEQNAFYEKMRPLLTADPEWHDCDVVLEEKP